MLRSVITPSRLVQRASTVFDTITPAAPVKTPLSVIVIFVSLAMSMLKPAAS